MIKKVLIIPYKIENNEILYFVGFGEHAKKWKFPTGHIGDDPEFADETNHDGARRELAEELGIQYAKNFFFTGLEQSFFQWHEDTKRNGDVKELAFAADITGSKIEVEKQEFSEYKFLNYKDALKILGHQAHRIFLNQTDKIIKNHRFPKIFLICGPSGSGKGAIVDRIIANKSLKTEKSRTATTRKKRPGETDERMFVSEEEFEQMDKAGELIEKNKYHDCWYGSPRKNLNDVLDRDHNAILEIDINGVISFKNIFSNIVAIFINVDLDDLRGRLEKRATESKEAIDKRINIAKTEMAKKDICDFVVDNEYGKLDYTIEKISKIIKGDYDEKK
jgi:guanylate kinase